MTKTRYWLSCLLTIAGCQTLAHDAPARIVDADAASRAELQEVVNTAVGTTVKLADDALTKNNVLLVERTPPRTIASQNLQGRVMEKPIRFQLVTDGRHCILIDERTDTRHELMKTKCAALISDR